MNYTTIPENIEIKGKTVTSDKAPLDHYIEYSHRTAAALLAFSLIAIVCLAWVLIYPDSLNSLPVGAFIAIVVLIVWLQSHAKRLGLSTDTEVWGELMDDELRMQNLHRAGTITLLFTLALQTVLGIALVLSGSTGLTVIVTLLVATPLTALMCYCATYLYLENRFQ